MSLFTKKRFPSAHWSVDFVEHLRSIHFALVAVSLGLIILVSGSRDVRISRALTQATEIAELETRWKEAQTTLYLAAAQSINLPTDGRTFFVTVAAPTPAMPEEGVRIRLGVPTDAFSQYEKWKFSDAVMDKAPRKLSEFRVWWRKMQAGVRVFVPDFSEKKHETCDAEVLQRDERGRAEVISFDTIGSFQPPGAPPLDSAVRCSLGDLVSFISETSIGVKPQFETELLESGAIVLRGRAENVKTTTSSGRKLTTEVWVDVMLTAQAATINEKALQEMFSDWRSGPYDQAFPELAAISGDLENIDLKGMASRIQDLQPKGEQNFEAFGLKVPSADITRWGTVLLLALQFYFWLHLHELNQKIDRDSPGWDVAWIGVYRSTSATVSMYLSGSLLPLIAVLILALRIPRDVQAAAHRWIPWSLAVMLCLCGGVLSALTAERLYHLRRNPANPSLDIDVSTESPHED